MEREGNRSTTATGGWWMAIEEDGQKIEAAEILAGKSWRAGLWR
jgi:hypothetical protein